MAGGSLGRGDRCYANVTNLSLVHCACHAAASRADRAMKQPRSEWDGATLRNQAPPPLVLSGHAASLTPY